MLDQKTIKTIKKIIFRYLDPKENKAFIFGSRAEGGGRKFSDIDIGVIKNNQKAIPSGVLGNLREAFEESDIPYTVDVVDFCDISDRFKNVAVQKVIPLN